MDRQTAYMEIATPTRIAIDIGSTIVKFASIDSTDTVIDQAFYPRDFQAGIAKQIEALLDQFHHAVQEEKILICSSANGGLRVGIVCLSKQYSGAVLRNQALSAGANPIFVCDLDDSQGNASAVDILLVGGGIDCIDAKPLESRLRQFKPDNYRYGSLFYAGNRHLASLFTSLFPNSYAIPNPQNDTLLSTDNSVFEALRRAYLDDLVYKEGVSELRNNLSLSIRPTPEVVNLGFQRVVSNHSSIAVAGACVLIDIGGATTDLHYTVEIVCEDSHNRPSAGASVARYVFTDLGIVASHDSTLLRLRSHPRLYELLSTTIDREVRDVYRLLREGDYDPTPNLLAYACLFLGLDRFTKGQGPGLPSADLNKVAQFILTGGAAQSLEVGIIEQVIGLFLNAGGSNPGVYIDKDYQIWVDGITWVSGLPV